MRTDHSALTFLRSAKEPVGQQARWQDYLEQFDCEFEHRAGARHGNADALSRKTCETEDLTCRLCSKKDTDVSVRAVLTQRSQKQIRT